MTPRQDVAVGPVPATRPDRAPLPANRDPRCSTAIDPDVAGMAADAALVGETRRRVRREIEVNDRRSGLLTGGSFIVAVAGWILLAQPPHVAIGTFAACVAVYIVAGSVEFEIGPGSALPTTPVLVVMLFLLPAQLVPVAVVLGLAGAALVARLRDPERRERAIVLVGSGWHAVGPAAVFALAHVAAPALPDWPVYLLALLAQLTFDATSSWVRNCHGLGVQTEQLAGALQFTFVCDLLLAPIGFAAALAMPQSPGALLLLLPPIALLAMLQSDRRKQLDHTVALGAAYTDTNALARRDVLTGLANRLRWEEATARYEGMNSALGVVFADVDGLKTANDEYGHATGDRLLIAVAEILVSEASALSGAVVARIGGDEFAILLPDASVFSTHALVSSLRVSFRDGDALDGVIPISASVGFGFAPCGSALAAAITAADRGVNIEKITRGVQRR